MVLPWWEKGRVVEEVSHFSLFCLGSPRQTKDCRAGLTEDRRYCHSLLGEGGSGGSETARPQIKMNTLPHLADLATEPIKGAAPRSPLFPSLRLWHFAQGSHITHQHADEFIDSHSEVGGLRAQ